MAEGIRFEYLSSTFFSSAFSLFFLKQLFLCGYTAFVFLAKVFISKGGRNPSPRCSVYEAFLYEKRLIYILKCVLFFMEACRKGFYAHRAAAEFVYYGEKYLPVHLVKTPVIYLQAFQRLVSHCPVYYAVRLYLRKIPDPFQQSVGNPRRAP